MGKINLLGINIDNVDLKNALNKTKQMIKEDRAHIICTPNPEIVMTAQTDLELKNILNNSDLVIADGIGLIYGARLRGKKLGRVTGCELINNLLEIASEENYSFYFLGAQPGVSELAKNNLEKKYPSIKILGVHNGYFKEQEMESVINDINLKKPDILLVGLGSPKQEKFLWNNREKLNIKIGIGCGGGIDILAGTIKRAPKIVQKLGFEWLYRMIKEPTRRKRARAIPQFIMATIFNKN